MMTITAQWQVEQGYRLDCVMTLLHDFWSLDIVLPVPYCLFFLCEFTLMRPLLQNKEPLIVLLRTAVLFFSMASFQSSQSFKVMTDLNQYYALGKQFQVLTVIQTLQVWPTRVSKI